MSERHGHRSQPYDGPLLQVTDLVKEFPVGKKGFFGGQGKDRVHAVAGISFTLDTGETLGLVGESGCGKSTAGRAILHLHPPTSGSVVFEGQELTTMSDSQLRVMRRDMQIVFQDPYASLNPRWTINDILSEPFEIHKSDTKVDAGKRVGELMELVGLKPEHRNRYAHEFSGGQRQRIGVARALALNPKMIILDEPVSALDVSVQAGVVNLLEDLQDQLGLAYLFIAHDLSVVRHISDRVAVMYLGKIIEMGRREDVYTNPKHPYTVALLSAAPEADPNAEGMRERIILAGDVPSPINPPSGCRFRTRCWKAQDICATTEPPLQEMGDGHVAACHFPVTDQDVEYDLARKHRATVDADVLEAREAQASG